MSNVTNNAAFKQQFVEFLRASELCDVPAYSDCNNIVSAHTNQYVLSGVALLNSIRIVNSEISVWYFTSDKHSIIQRKHTAHCTVGYLIEYIRKHCHTNQTTNNTNATQNHINISTGIQSSNITSNHSLSQHHVSTSTVQLQNQRIIGTWCPDTMINNNTHTSTLPRFEHCSIDSVAVILSESAQQSTPYTGWLHLYNTSMCTSIQQRCKHVYIQGKLQYNHIRPIVETQLYCTEYTKNTAYQTGKLISLKQVSTSDSSKLNLTSICQRVERHTRAMYEHCDTLLRAQVHDKPIVHALTALYVISDTSDKLILLGATDFNVSNKQQSDIKEPTTIRTTDSSTNVVYSIAERQPCVNCCNLITTAQNDRAITMLNFLYIKVAMRYTHFITTGELFYTLAKQYDTHISNCTEEQFKHEFMTQQFIDQKLRICARCDKDLSLSVDKNGLIWSQIDDLRKQYLGLQSYNAAEPLDTTDVSHAANASTTAQPRSKTLNFDTIVNTDAHRRRNASVNSFLQFKKHRYRQAMENWQTRQQQLRHRQHDRVARQARRQAEADAAAQAQYCKEFGPLNKNERWLNTTRLVGSSSEYLNVSTDIGEQFNDLSAATPVDNQYPFIHNGTLDPAVMSNFDSNISAPETRVVYNDTGTATISKPKPNNVVKKDWDFSIQQVKSFDDFQCNSHTAKVHDKLIYFEQQWSNNDVNSSRRANKIQYAMDDLSEPFTYEQMISIFAEREQIAG